MAKSQANNINLKTLTEHDKYDPVKNLWRNVLTVGVQDFLKKKKLHFQFNIKGKYSSEEAWFYHDDFKLVCEFAKMEHSMIKRKVFEIIERMKNEKTNMFKMQGKRLHHDQEIDRSSNKHNQSMSTV